MSNSKKKQKTNDVDRLLDGYDVTCLVLGEPMNKSWSVVSVSVYTRDNRWILGMTLITSIGEILDCARRNKLSIIFESMLHEQQQD